jgi:ABC-2 type transport system permease protein
MRGFSRLFSTTVKAFYRDRVLMFFTLLFPLLLGIIFGSVFGGSSDYTTKVGLLAGDGALEKVLAEKHEIRIVKFKNEGELKKAISEAAVPIGMVLKDDRLFAYLNKVSVLSDPYLRNLPGEISEKLSTPKEFSDFGIAVDTIEVQSGRVRASNNSFLIPGIIAVSLFTSGVFSAIELFSRYKEKFILKRVQVTSLSSYLFIIATILGRMVVSVASAAILFGIMIAMFKVQFVINWPLFALSILLGSMLMLALGTFVALIFRSYVAATNFASILMTVMFFFAGIYFPLELLPRYLQTFGKALPLYHLAATMRMVMGVEKLVPSYLYIEFASILVAFSLLTVVAGKLIFRRD